MVKMAEWTYPANSSRLLGHRTETLTGDFNSSDRHGVRAYRPGGATAIGVLNGERSSRGLVRAGGSSVKEWTGAS